MTPDEDSAAYMLAAARIARLETELREAVDLLRGVSGHAPRRPHTMNGGPDLGDRIDAFLAAHP
jgi:hypothetical protein